MKENCCLLHISFYKILIKYWYNVIKVKCGWYNCSEIWVNWMKYEFKYKIIISETIGIDVLNQENIPAFLTALSTTWYWLTRKLAYLMKVTHKKRARKSFPTIEVNFDGIQYDLKSSQWKGKGWRRKRWSKNKKKIQDFSYVWIVCSPTSKIHI